VEFRVWAPRARAVDLDLGGRQRAMTRHDGGWWSVDVPDAKAGTDYAFRVDDSEPLPDPRSPWQPSGVHGPSRTVDHASFKWSDREWR